MREEGWRREELWSMVGTKDVGSMEEGEKGRRVCEIDRVRERKGGE